MQSEFGISHSKKQIGLLAGNFCHNDEINNTSLRNYPEKLGICSRRFPWVSKTLLGSSHPYRPRSRSTWRVGPLKTPFEKLHKHRQHAIGDLTL
jgi:hypothetical protein